MRQVLATCLVAAAVTTPAPALANHTDYFGGCGFRVFEDEALHRNLVLPDNRWTGVHYIVATATNAGGVPSGTSFITVRCDLYIDGILTDISWSAGGIGAALGVGQMTYRAAPDDVVTVCETVTVDHEVHGTSCDNATVNPLLPELVEALADDLLINIIDPLICPINALAAPGVPGVVDINAEGDIDVLGRPYYFCPPY